MIDNASLAADLVGAASRGELTAYFQPQVDLATGRIVAAEALCRWRHPKAGVISPSVFIGLAEQTNVIGEIGEFMLDAGCELLDGLTRADRALDISVNVSPLQLLTPALVDRLVLQVAALSLDPTRLTIEVTESLEIIEMQTVVARLIGLRGHGVGISIDDFGSGHASTELVLRLPVTELKIDRSLVQGESDSSRTRFRDVMVIARRDGIRVVAEGVETDAHLEYVTRAGCHRAQGYLLGRAKPRAEFEAMLEATR